MSIPNPSPRTRAPCPLDTVALMAAVLMAGEIDLGADCPPPEFYALRALELYLAVQEHVEPKLQAQPAQGNQNEPPLPIL